MVEFIFVQEIYSITSTNFWINVLEEQIQVSLYSLEIDEILWSKCSFNILQECFIITISIDHILKVKKMAKPAWTGNTFRFKKSCDLLTRQLLFSTSEGERKRNRSVRLTDHMWDQMLDLDWETEGTEEV